MPSSIRKYRRSRSPKQKRSPSGKPKPKESAKSPKKQSVRKRKQGRTAKSPTKWSRKSSPKRRAKSPKKSPRKLKRSVRKIFKKLFRPSRLSDEELSEVEDEVVNIMPPRYIVHPPVQNVAHVPVSVNPAYPAVPVVPLQRLADNDDHNPLACMICQTYLRNCTFLCGHSYCSRCAQALVDAAKEQHQEQVLCPQCRVKVLTIVPLFF